MGAVYALLRPFQRISLGAEAEGHTDPPYSHTSSYIPGLGSATLVAGVFSWWRDAYHLTYPKTQLKYINVVVVFLYVFFSTTQKPICWPPDLHSVRPTVRLLCRPHIPITELHFC